jgi:dienelactone hydrolase
MTTDELKAIPIPYKDNHRTLEGYLVARRGARNVPGVLVVPTWLNVDAGICLRADRLANHGYTVFVADLFGVGIRPAPPELPMSVVAPLLADRASFRRRLTAALETFQVRSECAKNNIAAVGYCLGGCGVLELARAGAPLKGIVALHGILSAPMPAEPNAIRAKVLVLHGDADPVVPVSEVTAFTEEMRSARANWEIDIYGDARHSFSGEGVANKATPEAGLHPQSEDRSWQTTLRFLKEVLT